jgi:hypothetical protein
MQNLRWQGIFTKKWLVVRRMAVNEGVKQTFFFLSRNGPKTGVSGIPAEFI